MICETVHNFAAMPASLLAVSFAIGWQRAHPYHSLPSARTYWPTHGRRFTHRRSGPILNVRSAYGPRRVD